MSYLVAYVVDWRVPRQETDEVRTVEVKIPTNK